MSAQNRCTVRKHVKERGTNFCDCGALMFGIAAADNAVVVTIIDPLQRETLKKLEDATS